ncbi:hypothetical protein C808_03015, partial [Lachnospiraceae bacterium M18-1]
MKYPSASLSARRRISREQGTPLWPSGRFIRYTQGHPIMAIRPFHKVYPRASH